MVERRNDEQRNESDARNGHYDLLRLFLLGRWPGAQAAFEERRIVLPEVKGDGDCGSEEGREITPCLPLSNGPGHGKQAKPHDDGEKGDPAPCSCIERFHGPTRSWHATDRACANRPIA